MIQIVREVFPQLNDQLNQLPDPRRQDMCRYDGAHIWWTITGMYFFRTGSRNAFDEKRNSGQAPWNLGDICGQPGDDWRFEGKPTVTCTDPAVRDRPPCGAGGPGRGAADSFVDDPPTLETTSL